MGFFLTFWFFHKKDFLKDFFCNMFFKIFIIVPINYITCIKFFLSKYENFENVQILLDFVGFEYLQIMNTLLGCKWTHNKHCATNPSTLMKKNYQDAKEKKWWCIWNTPMLWSSRICLMVIWHQHDSCKHCYGSSFNPQSALPKSNSHSSCFYQHPNFLTSEVCKIWCQHMQFNAIQLPKHTQQ